MRALSCIVACVFALHLLVLPCLVSAEGMDRGNDNDVLNGAGEHIIAEEHNDWAAMENIPAIQANDESPYFKSLTINWDNDAFVGTDHDYTNGFKLTWSTPYGALDDDTLPPWSIPVFKRLPFADDPGSTYALSLSIGQDIYNPDDTDRSELVDDDRPYAGYSYLAAEFQTRRTTTKDTWQIIVGLVGPSSLAEEVQNLTHDMLGVDHASGWDNQLNDEVTFDIRFHRQWRLWSASRREGIAFDLIPHIGGQVGTTKTHLNAGAEFRAGWNLPNDFGSCPSHEGCESNSSFLSESKTFETFHFFLSTDGKVLARDIFLDGNTFSDSHSVDKKHIVGELAGGFAWQHGQIKITYAYIYQTLNFNSQKNNPVYGSLNFSWAY